MLQIIQVTLLGAMRLARLLLPDMLIAQNRIAGRFAGDNTVE
jgi:hypothetical protein